MPSGKERKLKIRLLHYWLVSFRGGERVLREISLMLRPDDCVTHLLEPEVANKVDPDCSYRETSFARLPKARRAYKVLFPLMYLASYFLPVSDADLVVSSESGPIKGIRRRKGSLHVCYCHSPFRILWAPAEWYRPVLGVFAYLLPLLRLPLRWTDRLTARSVDCFIANSRFIQDRIARAYGRSSTVIHPPVDVDRFHVAPEKGDYFLWLGELVSYKRPDLVIDAFSQSGLPLHVVGRGEMLERLKATATSNIRFLERVTDEELPEILSRARALVFSGVEDFGIVFVEALASGTPVVAYGQGGVLDSVKDGQTGILFDTQSVQGLLEGLDRFHEMEQNFDATGLRESALRFNPDRFREEFAALVNKELKTKGLPGV